jgi:hypothetical protein
MIKHLLFLISILVVHWGYTQIISKIDFELIRQQSTDSSSALFYPDLNDRLQRLDTSLKKEEYRVLYYGNIFQENYHPYGATETEKTFNDAFKQGDSLSQLLPLAQSVLNENPVNLDLFYKMIISANRAKDKNMAIKWAKIYVSFLEVIYASGTGKDCQHAFVVISVDDEYRITADLGLRVTKQALIGTCDRLQFAKKGQKRKNLIKTLFFNVQMPLSYLSGAFDHMDKPLPDQKPDEEE